MSKSINDIIETKSAFLENKNRNKNLELSEDRVRETIPTFTEYISFWREYPDMFIDMIKEKDSKFKFYFYQRIFLRCAMRHRYFFGTFNCGRG